MSLLWSPGSWPQGGLFCVPMCYNKYQFLQFSIFFFLLAILDDPPKAQPRLRRADVKEAGLLLVSRERCGFIILRYCKSRPKDLRNNFQELPGLQLGNHTALRAYKEDRHDRLLCWLMEDFPMEWVLQGQILIAPTLKTLRPSDRPFGRSFHDAPVGNVDWAQLLEKMFSVYHHGPTIFFAFFLT